MREIRGEREEGACLPHQNNWRSVWPWRSVMKIRLRERERETRESVERGRGGREGERGERESREISYLSNSMTLFTSVSVPLFAL